MVRKRGRYMYKRDLYKEISLHIHPYCLDAVVCKRGRYVYESDMIVYTYRTRPIWRDLHTYKRDLYTNKNDQNKETRLFMRTKETYIKRYDCMSNFIAWMQWYAKEAGICTKETWLCIRTERDRDKETWLYIRMKETYICTKETYIYTNETYMKRHDFVYVWKRLMYVQKRPS